jgi:hypothetical protein
MPDVEFNEFKVEHPGMTDECLNAVRYGRDWASAVDDADCFEMLPPQRWSGLWNTGWEWSIFCPKPATTCPVTSADRGISLRFAGSEPHREAATAGGTVFQVEFIGRRTKVAGYHGHLDQYAHLMMVDRLISIRQVPQ